MGLVYLLTYTFTICRAVFQDVHWSIGPSRALIPLLRWKVGGSREAFDPLRQALRDGPVAILRGFFFGKGNPGMETPKMSFDSLVPKKWRGEKTVLRSSIFQGVLFGSKGWCMVTPSHPFSTLWKIQVVSCFHVFPPLTNGSCSETIPCTVPSLLRAPEPRLQNYDGCAPRDLDSWGKVI